MELWNFNTFLEFKLSMLLHDSDSLCGNLSMILETQFSSLSYLIVCVLLHTSTPISQFIFVLDNGGVSTFVHLSIPMPLAATHWVTLAIEVYRWKEII